MPLSQLSQALKNRNFHRAVSYQGVKQPDDQSLKAGGSLVRNALETV